MCRTDGVCAGALYAGLCVFRSPPEADIGALCRRTLYLILLSVDVPRKSHSGSRFGSSVGPEAAFTK